VLVATLVAWSSTVARAAPSPEGAGAAGRQATADGRKTLRVTVDPGIDDAARIPQWVAERNAATLGRLGEQPGHERWVEVSVGGETYAYRIEVTAMRDGKPLGPKREPVVCECTSEELLQRIDGEVLRAVEELEQPMVEGPVEPETPPGESGEPPNGEEPVHDNRTPRWLLPTGATLTAVGGAGVVAGVVMAAVGERPVRAEGIQIVQGRDWRNPTGYVVLGVGAGVLAGGVTMLVLHHRGCKRAPGSCGGKEAASRRGPGQRDWAVLPWIGRGELGVGIIGRFSGRSG
jgi:hypothetical protein